jgi:peptide-methionine (S)-S-oxide reductase
MAESCEVATVGGGCFWCVEAVFQCLKGVLSAESGYAGGQVAYPLYEMVCTGTTGHAEVVQITFDPAIISYGELLAVFWSCHNPTTRNRQGHDIGSQYRSIILCHNDRQLHIAEQSKADADASGLWPAPIVTEIVPFTVFYKADWRHQDYYRSHPEEAYCQVVIDPKIAKLRRDFLKKVK